MRGKQENFSLLIIPLVTLTIIFTSVLSQSIEFNYTKRPSKNQNNKFFDNLKNSTHIKKFKSEFYFLTQNEIKNFLDFNFLSYGTELPLINSVNDEMIVNLCLGTPPQCFNVLVDSGSFVLWVTNIYSPQTPDANNKFDFKRSSTFSNTNKPYNIQYGTGSAQGYVTKDVISLGKTKLPNFNFILVDKEEGHQDLDGILGLGYNYEDFDYESETFSLIDKLHSENLIKRKIFTQKYNDDRTGSMVIGDLPDEISNDMQNYGNCTLVRKDSGRKNPMWQCEMKLLNYGDTEKDVIIVNQPALFDTGTNLIVAPYNFLKKIFDNYLDNPSVKGQCILDAPEGRFYSIICNRFAFVHNLPSLYFVFGEWALMMKPREMFFIYPDGTVRFIISSDPTLNEWIIGEPLMKKFHMVFDKENHVIGFYGKEGKVRYTGHLPQPGPDEFDYYALLFYFLLVCGAMILLAFLIRVIVTIVYYFKLKNNRDVSDRRYQAFRGNYSY
jgi:saccharopepsin